MNNELESRESVYNNATQRLPLQLIDEGVLRFRDVGDIISLANSISRVGQIQPIAVARKEFIQGGAYNDENPKKRFLLLAGKRRYTALKSLNTAIILVRMYGHEGDILTPSRIRQIELDENTEREDMTWAEQVNLTVQIRDHLEEEHGKSLAGSPVTKGARLEDIGEVLKKSKMSVSRDIKLAEAIKTNPKIAKAKTKKDALRILQMQELKRVEAEMVKRRQVLDAEYTSKLDNLLNRYIVGDSLEELKKLSDNSFYFAELDPPFAINMAEDKKTRPNLAEFPDWTVSFYQEYMPKVCTELYRVMRTDSWGIIWFGFDSKAGYTFILLALQSAGFTVDAIPLIWEKGSGHGSDLVHRFPSTYEGFLYFRKGSPPLATQGRPRVFQYPAVRTDRIHETEKPIELYKEIIRTFCTTWSDNLSVFAGSGTFMEASLEMGREVIGFDISQERKDKFSARLGRKYLTNGDNE